MKILMVLDEEFPPDVRVEKEIRALQRAGHQVHLLCYSRSGLSGHREEDGIAVFRIPLSRVMYKMKALALLLPFYFRFWSKHIHLQLRDENYDILHFHDLTLAKVCIGIAREKGLKVVADYHENRPEIMQFYDHVRRFPGNMLISPKAWKKYQLRYSKLPDQLVLVTEEAKAYYHRQYGIPAEKITVVENFPDLDELLSYRIDESVTARYNDRQVILYFGDTGSRRGLYTLLDAAALLQEDTNFHFIIIGSSREQSLLLDYAKSKKLDNVEFTGVLPLREAVSYFAAARAGTCPFLRNIHHDTTYANKMFQYMAFGLPVVVSNCTAQENVVRESGCGLVHEAGNARDLANKIVLLAQPATWTEMSKHAREAVNKKYNFNVSGRKLQNLYTALENEA